jgi:hypothetical protein
LASYFLPEIRKIAKEEIVPLNKRIDDVNSKIEGIKLLLDERFKAVNDRLDAKG